MWTQLGTYQCMYVGVYIPHCYSDTHTYRASRQWGLHNICMCAWQAQSRKMNEIALPYDWSSLAAAADARSQLG